MDVVVAIAAGLSLRLFLNNVDDPLRALTPAILGLCEGAIVRYLSNRASSVDHYLAYGLRIVVDLLFTQNITRMLIVLLWTIISVIALEAISPTPRRRETKRSRRSTAAHPVTTHASRPQQLANTPPLHLPLTHTPPHCSENDSNLISAAPFQHPSRPPSPPSFFLEGETEINILSPLSEQQLEYAPEPNSPSDAFSLGVALLSTPPGMRVIDAQESDRTLSHHRLSTIQELSSDETTNINRTDQWAEPDAHTPGIYMTYDKANTSYAPSVATSAPLPVPNSTYIHPPYRNVPDNDHTELLNSSPDSASAPLPVPNAALRSQLSSGWNADMTSEPDELRTPGAHCWELTDQDELITPPGEQKVLSPLFPDQQLPAGFNVTQEAVADISPLLIPAVDHGISNLPSSAITVMSTLVNSSVECFPKVVNDQNPDLDILSEPETLQTENAESVMSPVGNSVEQFSRGEFFRQEAWKEEKQRIDLDNRLKAALREARIRDVLFLREEIRVLEERTKKLHEKAARRFFKARNKSLMLHTIDVHGLRVAEAVRQTEKALRDALTHGFPDLRVIVGKGLHSRNRTPVLKQAIIREMQINKIPCRIDPFNTGVLIISLPSS